MTDFKEGGLFAPPSVSILNRVNFETYFLENKNLFQKTGVRLLVETNKIEKTSFTFKTALSEANVKTNSMATIKWTYQ